MEPRSLQRWLHRPIQLFAVKYRDDGADRATADLGCDLLGRGQAVEGGLRGVGGQGDGSGGRRTAVGGGAWRGRGVRPGGAADQPGFERLGAEQAARDAREDFRDVAGAEWMRVAAECGGEVPAVVDELPDEGEEAAEAVGFGVGGGLNGGHKRDMTAGVESASRNLFLIIPLTKQDGSAKVLFIGKSMP